MENGWNLFNFNNTTSPSFGRGHNSSNCTTTAVWDIWESGAAGSTSRIDWISSINPHNSFTSSASTTAVPSSTTATHEESAAAVQALMFAHQGNHDHAPYSSFAPSRLYSGGGGGGGGSHNYVADPHLMCLKLGKRHYFGEAIATPISDRQAETAYSITKKGKPYYDACGGTGSLGPSTSAGVTVASQAPVPRCQVDGCNVLLLNAKDYHRRHKVCEMHSKAPKVVVLGLEQRFCQQCSRFHAVSEFDESKRSCRRRLAGHNERRRKSSQEHSGIRNQSQMNSKLMNYHGRQPYLPLNSGCALSLLSSKNESWISATDLPTRCSAALRELIAENRAAILARQLIHDKDWHWRHHPAEDLNGRQQSGSNSILNYQQQMATSSHNWEHIGEAEAHVTLDLMQAPNSAFGLWSMRGKSKEDDQECPELWSSFGGAHVV